uniref:Uncharacterized protein n=1 Tax=Panagrolaimus davidi TaxID=227884 RepID=A0A914QK60_9BILA
MAFIGDLSGITERNKTNATYQSMIDGELMYEYAIYRFNKKQTRATFRCAGCRSAISDGRAPEFKIYYLKGAIDFETKKVIFDNPCFQHQNNIHIPQQFNMSLPVYYQQPPPQQFYVQQFPPYFYNPRF